MPCAGFANAGSTPRIAPGSPVVFFNASLAGVDPSDLLAWMVQFPDAVLNVTNSPDTSVILLGSDDEDDWDNIPGDKVVSLAVVFNRVPVTSALQSAKLFFQRLNATTFNSSLVPFPSYVSVANSVLITDLDQQNVTAGKAFCPDNQVPWKILELRPAGCLHDDHVHNHTWRY